MNKQLFSQLYLMGIIASTITFWAPLNAMQPNANQEQVQKELAIVKERYTRESYYFRQVLWNLSFVNDHEMKPLTEDGNSMDLPLGYPRALWPEPYNAETHGIPKFVFRPSPEQIKQFEQKIKDDSSIEECINCWVKTAALAQSNNLSPEISKDLARNIIAQAAYVGHYASYLPRLHAKYKQEESAKLKDMIEEGHYNSMKSLREQKQNAEALSESYRKIIERISNEKNEEKEAMVRQMSEQSAQAAKEFMDVRGQLSPLKARAKEVSPLRAQIKAKNDELEAKNAEIEQLKRILAARPSYASVTNNKDVLK